LHQSILKIAAMGKLIKVLLVGTGIYVAVHLNGGNPFEKNIAATLAADNEVVMYSLTTCPYCKEKRQWMTRAGIPFREYFIDTDQARMQELNGLLASHNVPPGGVGTPVIYVNGDLLVNNPERAAIRNRLRTRS
jgi:glutaredoxin